MRPSRFLCGYESESRLTVKPMWSQVQSDLEQLIASRIYPALLEDAVYRAFLVFAGMKLSELGDYSIPARLQRDFRAAAKMKSHIIVSEIKKSGALAENSAGAKLCNGNLYRLWDSTAPEYREGIWWFESDVIDVCKKNTPRSPDIRKQWLREHLAVSLDWSKLNRIDYIAPKSEGDVPAIVGIGDPMPIYSPNAVSAKQSSTSGKPLPFAKTTPKEYFANVGKFFPGGIRQTILPFLPRSTGMDINAFLNKG